MTPSTVHRARRGIVTLEVLGVMPILLIFAVSIAEFSMAMRLHHKVAFASRYGAKLAAEAPRVGPGSLAELNIAGSPESLKARIDGWLISAGLSPSLAVRLDHNACGLGGTQQWLTDEASANPPEAELPALPPGDPQAQVAYVRVTVWLPLGRNLPNALRTFGLDWNGAAIHHATTFRLESDNQYPVPDIRLDANDLPQGVNVDPASLSTAARQRGEPIRLTTDRPGSLVLPWTAAGSRDAETPAGRLRYRWTTTGDPLGATNRRDFASRVTLNSPLDTTRIQLALDVSDECSCSSKLEIPVEIRRSDALQGIAPGSVP